MKIFEVPEVKFVRFNSSDVIAASGVCDCNQCPECPPGSNDCPCVDFISSDYKG